MTYVSRRTRIIVSSKSDECNAEYILQAYRKRSDGRLKNYSSCEDLRAWINDNCIKNEYLVELMSKNEFLGKPPFALYGRFIPVPILFRLLENKNTNDEKKSSERNAKEMSWSKKRESESENLSRVQWEKNQAEKNLLDCIWLLNTAVIKLEKVENIIEITNNETEKARTKEIQDAFNEAKNICSCRYAGRRSSSYMNSNNISESHCAFGKRKSKDSATCDELTRKIFQLKRKLKEVQACHCEIIHQIRKAEKSAPSVQVTELFSRNNQNLIKKLQEESEKLIVEKEKLFSEMDHVLNTLKISPKASLTSKKHGRCEISGGFKGCQCGCKIFENYESTDSENLEFNESRSPSEFSRARDDSYNFTEPPERLLVDCSDREPEKLYNDRNLIERGKSQRRISNYALDTPPTSLKISNLDPHLTASQEKAQKFKKVERKKKEEKTKKSKVKFICDVSPCKKNIYGNDLSAFESSLTPEQKAVISKAVKNIKSRRPSTTPTTKREKRELSLKCEPSQNSSRQTSHGSGKISLRRVKSEIMIKEFEKTLRNYERRLNDLDSLEFKLESLKQKSSEVCRLRRKLEKVKVEAKKQRAADKEKFNLEITRLCSENWELKKHVQQLEAKSDAQNKKILNLKCSVMKARGLECEAEELKKKLSEYRDSFERQRKCNSKWESVFAMQRTEIENLTNRIRKLTAVKETQHYPHQDKKYTQRSRSYSPEIGKEKSKNIRRKNSRELRLMSEEEESNCCCGEHPKTESRKKIQLKNLSRGCFTPSHSSMNWYK